jgi:hypothetical protein
VSYEHFVEHTLFPVTTDDDEQIKALYKVQKKTLRAFCDPGQPGASLRRRRDELVCDEIGPDRACWARPVASYFELLRKLLFDQATAAGRTVTIVFRTFGGDVDMVRDAHDSWCDDHDLLDYKFREGEALSWREGETLQLERDRTSVGGGVAVLDETEALAYLTEEVFRQPGTVFIQDSYLRWFAARRQPSGGKVFPLDPSDPTSFTLFFDDHAAKVVDARTPDGGAIPPEAAYPWVVRADPVQAVSDPDYFWKLVVRAEQHWMSLKAAVRASDVRALLLEKPALPVTRATSAATDLASSLGRAVAPSAIHRALSASAAA